MKRNHIIAIALVVIGLIIAGVFVVTQLPSEATPFQGSQSAGDTAIAVFTSANQPTRTYRTEQHLSLNQWHRITVYGETFPACAILYEGNDTVLTVASGDSAICGDL
jgi:hypothetical protein